MNDFILGDFVFDLEVRDLQRPDGGNRHLQRLVCFRATLPAEALARGAQRPQHARTIEPLPFTMIAEAHEG